MKVAVCLQTCERLDLTMETMTSFVALNDVSKFDLLHGDDNSRDPEVRRQANLHGFRTVVKTRERQGATRVRAALIDSAMFRGADWVLVLENDCRSVRPFPWDLFEWLQQFDGVYCLRLFGEYKDAERLEPCKTRHQWVPDSPEVRWKTLRLAPEPAEIGSIHWSAQPSVTRTRDAMAIHQGARPRKLRTVRVVDNVMVHIGQQRTPGRVV